MYSSVISSPEITVDIIGEFESNSVNKKYLQTKRDKLGHLIMENIKK